jgi:hypothetical protein
MQDFLSPERHMGSQVTADQPASYRIPDLERENLSYQPKDEELKK